MPITLNSTPSDRGQNSYVSLARANDYFSKRPNSEKWINLTNGDEIRKQALIHASNLVDNMAPGYVGEKRTNYNNDQVFHFPNNAAFNVTGTIDSAPTSTTVIDSQRAGLQYEPDDFWNYGSIKITSGTGAGQTREIEDFDSATGTITITEAWTIDPDNTSKYEIVVKVPDQIFEAVCETAFGLMPDPTSGEFDDNDRGTLQLEGVLSQKIGDFAETYSGHAKTSIPILARELLSKWVKRGL